MKKLDTYKLILYPLTLVILIIYSVLQVGLDLTKISTGEFWLELFLKYLIQMLWIYFGVPDGKVAGTSRQDYSDAKKSLNKSISLIKDKGLLNTFTNYVKSDYETQRKQFIDDTLFANGIPKDLYAKSLREIKNLLPQYDLSKLHYLLIRKLKHGNFYFPFVPAQTYLSAYDVKNKVQMALYNEKSVVLRELFPKMVLTFFTLALSSSAIVSQDVSMGQAVYDSVFNVGLSIMSYGFAYALGLSIMSDYAKLYDFRKNYISKFIENYDSGKYVPDLAVYTIEKVVE
jgi:hypothetical protein